MKKEKIRLLLLGAVVSSVMMTGNAFAENTGPGTPTEVTEEMSSEELQVEEIEAVLPEEGMNTEVEAVLPEEGMNTEVEAVLPEEGLNTEIAAECTKEETVDLPSIPEEMSFEKETLVYGDADETDSVTTEVITVKEPALIDSGMEEALTGDVLNELEVSILEEDVPKVAEAEVNYKVNYRLYNQRTGEHLYTQDANEWVVLTSGEWTPEGTSWVTPDTGMIPVHRVFNPQTGEHHYTKDNNEVRVLTTQNGWNYEGIAWYSDPEEGIPVYRLFCPSNPSIASHHYTKDANEKNVLLATMQWIFEGISWFGADTGETSYPYPAPWTPKPTSNSTSTSTRTSQMTSVPSGGMVWISMNGSKYHSRSGCSNMRNPSQVTLSKAVSRGYTPCKKCY